MHGPKWKHFEYITDKISSEQLTKVEKSNRVVTAELQKMSPFYYFPRPGKSDPYVAPSLMQISNKTIGDEGITVDFWIIKVHTSN